MSRKHRRHQDDAAPESQAPEAETPATDVDEVAAMVPAEDPIARLEAEAATLKDQLLRALAETENLRRRAARDRDDAVKYAAVPLIRDLIAVADNLRRALDSVPSDAASGNEQLKTVLDGVELTEKELQAIFARHAIERLEPLGERLDPHFHEAMFEIPDASVPAGTILQVLQAGYRLRDRLIRPAQVGVAKGGPTASAAAPDPAPAGEPDHGGDEGNGQEKPGRHLDTSA